MPYFDEYDSHPSVSLLAIGLERSSNSFRIGSGSHCLGVGLVEDTLDDLLLLGSENFGQTFIELGLFLLKV